MTQKLPEGKCNICRKVWSFPQCCYQLRRVRCRVIIMNPMVTQQLSNIEFSLLIIKWCSSVSKVDWADWQQRFIINCYYVLLPFIYRQNKIKIINQSLSVYFSWLSDLIEGLLQHIYMQPCLDRTLASLHYCPPTIHSQIIVTFCIHNSHFADI